VAEVSTKTARVRTAQPCACGALEAISTVESRGGYRHSDVWICTCGEVRYEWIAENGRR
jgi:hypothetical protein